MLNQSKHFGLCLCYACHDDLTVPSALAFVDRNFEADFMNHELLVVGKRRNTMVHHPFKEQITNEAVGPLITALQVSQISSTYFKKMKNKDDGDDDDIDDYRHACMATEQALEDMAKRAVEQEKHKKGRSMNDNDNDNESNTNELAALGTTQRVPAMTEAYNDAQKNFASFMEAKKKIESKPKFDRDQKKRHTRRRNGGKKVVAKMMALISSDVSSEDDDKDEACGAFFQDNFAWLFESSFDGKGKSTASLCETL